MKQVIVYSLLMFVLIALALPTIPEAMFGDPDIFWHVAAGDLIRQTGTIPVTDPWAFTSAGERWYNLAWLWDVLASFLHERQGWFGLVALNSITVAATVAVVFGICYYRTRHDAAAFLASWALPVLMMGQAIRPYQVSYLMVPVLGLLLTQVDAKRISARWLAIVPVLVMLWANLHGGFLIPFAVIGIYSLCAALQKRDILFRQLVITGLISLGACLINPYGADIFAGAMRTLSSAALPAISEWKPLSLSYANSPVLLYIALFACAMFRKDVSFAEKLNGLFWLWQGLNSQRHMPIFGLMAAPMVALVVRELLIPKRPARPLPIAALIASKLTHLSGSTTGLAATSGLALAASLLLLSAPAQKLYDAPNPMHTLAPEIEFITTHYPNLRIMNDYDLGGYLIYYGKGNIPVWVDGRTETAYPKSVMNDFMAFLKAKPGWEEMLARYDLQGVLIPNQSFDLIDRFQSRKGWNTVYKGPIATLFVTDEALEPSAKKGTR